MANILRGFSVATVLRMTTPEVFKQCLDELGITKSLILPILPEHLKAQQKKEYVTALENAIKGLSDPDKKPIYKLLQRTYFLTKGHEYLRFLQSSGLAGKKEMNFLDDYKDNSYDKCMLCCAKFPDQVDKCYLVASLEHQNKRYWGQRQDYTPEKCEALSEEDLNAIQSAVQKYLKDEQRGQRCKRDNFELQGVQYIFFRTDDLPASQEVWNEVESEIDDIRFIPVFQIAIAYDRAKGIVNVCCENSTTRLNTHRAFAKEKFGHAEIPAFPKQQRAFRLEKALDMLLEKKRFMVAVPSKSPLLDLFITEVCLKLDSIRYKDAEIKLTSKQKKRTEEIKQPDEIYLMLKDFFRLGAISENSVHLNSDRIKSIVLTAVYRDEYDPSQTVSKRFMLSSGSICNLDMDGVDGEIRKCLEECGIIYVKEPEIPKVKGGKAKAQKDKIAA